MLNVEVKRLNGKTNFYICLDIHVYIFNLCIGLQSWVQIPVCLGSGHGRGGGREEGRKSICKILD